MDDFEKYLAEQMKDPEFRRRYEELEPLYAIKRQLTEARIQQRLTQEELADKIGMKQSGLARLERGESNPTLKSLQRIAHGLGKKLVITFAD